MEVIQPIVAWCYEKVSLMASMGEWYGKQGRGSGRRAARLRAVSPTGDTTWADR
jgi:hypothetical protein